MSYSLNTYPWHNSTWDKFVTARAQNHLPHALLIAGSDGTGKLDFAKRIATALLCTSPVNNEACQKCKSCKTYQADANPDFMSIELLKDKQQIAVDQIRKLSDFISYTRSYNAYRVILLNPVERMNNNASNSLLKSLEEPASNTIIILVASNLSKILPTIKSRCQILTLPNPTKTQALSWMQQQQHSNTTNPEELLEMANGQPLTALTLSEDDVKSRVELAQDLLAICTYQQPVTDIAKKWEKYDQSAILNWQIVWSEKSIKNSILQKNKEKKKSEIATILEKLDKHIATQQHWQLYQQLITQKQYIHTSVNSLMFLENMLLLWLQASQ